MLTDRQCTLLAYLQAHSDEWQKLFNIVYALGDTYGYSENLQDPAVFLNSLARRRLTKDIQAINNDDNVSVVIVSSTTKGIKIANEEEFNKYINNEYSAIFRKLKRVRKKDRKGRKNGQLYLLDNGEIKETTPFAVMRKEKGLKATEVVTAMKAIDSRFDGSLLSKIENGLCLPTNEMAIALTALYEDERNKHDD